jgi:hypothetical protein
VFNRLQKNIFYLIIGLLCVCCNKGSQEGVEPPDPFIRDSLSGVYRFGNFSWEVTEVNGSSFNSDKDGKVQIDYKGGKTVDITLLSGQYPYKKSFTAALRDSTADGMKFYKYDERFDSTATHWSEIHLHFRIHESLNSIPPYLAYFYFFDFTKSNGVVVSPSYSVRCTNFSRQ